MEWSATSHVLVYVVAFAIADVIASSILGWPVETYHMMLLGSVWGLARYLDGGVA